MMNEIEDNLSLCTSNVLSERVGGYNFITKNLSSPEGNLSNWGETLSSENVKKIIKNVKTDLFCDENDIAFETIGFLGCFLDNEKLMDCLSVAEEQETMDVVINLIMKCEEERILNRALWSFSQSKFGVDIYSKNIIKILNVIKNILEKEQTSLTRYEAMQVIKSLLESSANDMKKKIDLWLSLVFNSLFYSSARVRGVGYSCMLITKSMHQNEPTDILYSHISPLLQEFKDKHCKKMSKYIDEDCTYVTKIWRLIITILGKNLHPGTALINSFLEIVEKAFKSTNPELRADAFKCWQVLTSNFALDMKVIGHPKRLKLLSAPFKTNNAKTEDLANAKLAAWWHLVISLGDGCSNNFDIVVLPLLKYCFTINNSSTGFERGHMQAIAASPARKFPCLRIKYLEILSAVLQSENSKDHKNCTLSLPELKHRILTPAVLLKNYQVIFNTIGNALQIINTNILKQFSLGMMILNGIAEHVNKIICKDYHKKECIEMVKDLLSITTTLENANDNSILLEFVKTFVLHKYALPSNVINSRSYNVPIGSKPQELVSGTLNNFFIHKLLTPSLLAHKSNEIYKEIWDELIKKSKPACGKLSFFEFTLEELGRAAPLICSDSVDIYIDLWIQTCSHLHDYIGKEKIIDQGDGTDYDWRCMYKYLLFPIRNSQDYLSSIENTPNYENIVFMLNKLWSTFTSLCSLTATAEPNCECDFISKTMSSLLFEKFNGSPDNIAFTLTIMSELLYIMIGQFRFKDLGKNSIKE